MVSFTKMIMIYMDIIDSANRNNNILDIIVIPSYGRYYFSECYVDPFVVIII